MSVVVTKASRTERLVFDAQRTAVNARLAAEQRIIDGLHFMSELMNNTDKFDELFDMLADDESVSVLEWLIQYRVAVYHVGTKDAAGALYPPKITLERWNSMLEQAKSHAANSLEEQLEIDLVENWVLDGYSIAGICEVEKGDIVFDCGAFNGNSSLKLAEKCGPTGKVFAFEPNPQMVDVLRRNINRLGGKNIEIVNAAVSDAVSTARFVTQGAASRIQPDGGVEIAVSTIDKFVFDQRLPRVDFLKFDIEGFELPALVGAKETIKTMLPKIAVCVYHLHYDLTTIPFFLKQCHPEYQLYLRHNARYDGEVVMFCKP